MKKAVLLIFAAVVLMPVLGWTGCPRPDTLPSGTGMAYEHVNCNGWHLALSTRTVEADLRRFGGGQDVNDMISSIALGPGIRCEFYEHIDFKGNKFTLTKGVVDNLVKRRWNDKVSSIKCFPN